MGYTTEFYGTFTVTPPLNDAEVSYLKDFAETRRMARENGPYFVKGEGDFGQGSGPDKIHSFNEAPAGQPGLWCQWVPTAPDVIEWDGGEKFYNAAEWIKYLIDHFLRPGAAAQGSTADERLARFTFDHVVSGEVDAVGEDSDDRWRIVVEDNVVKTASASIVYETPRAL